MENSAERLLPQLQPAKWIEELAAYDLQAPVHQPFVAGLVIAYILDFDGYQVSMNPDVVQQFVGQFNPPIELVHEVAINNLDARTTREHYTISGEGDQTTIVCKIDDKFAASRILLPDLMAQWSIHIPGRMLLGIPHRDYLIAFSDRDPEHVSTMSQQVRRDAIECQNPLCGELLLWENGHVREYQMKH